MWIKRHKIWFGVIVYFGLMFIIAFTVGNELAIGEIFGELFFPYLLVLWLCVRQRKVKDGLH